ncbi:hypothetical protein MN0502_13330 [Arthrobacter sp. MN05-02]|nr:hypothetical protein MN0502_13330 [Arthrobacter sp. MN05-02]
MAIFCAGTWLATRAAGTMERAGTGVTVAPRCRAVEACGPGAAVAGWARATEERITAGRAAVVTATFRPRGLAPTAFLRVPFSGAFDRWAVIVRSSSVGG